MSKGAKWYYDLSSTVRLILAIIPFTSYFVHAIARITTGKPLSIVVGILSIILGIGLIMWIVDLVCVILKRKLILG